MLTIITYETHPVSVMPSDGSGISDLIEVSVPPISLADEERDLSDGQDIDLAEFADFAIDESGTVGGIGVALDSLQALSDDLDTFAQTGAAPGDLELHAEAIQEVVSILYQIADEEIDSYDNKLYHTPDPEPSEEEEQELDSERSPENTDPISSENLMKVTVDRISGSGNIIAEPVTSGPNHIHVQNGKIGETAIAYHPQGKLSSKGGGDKPFTLPYKSEKDVELTRISHDSIPLTEGQHIQVYDASKDEGFIYIDGFDLRAIKVDEEIKTGATVLLEITEVKTNTAVATLKKQSNPTTGSSNAGSTTISKRKARNTNRKSSGIPKVSNGLKGNKNDLISGKKL